MIESTLARLQGWRVGSEEDANDEHLRAVRARGVFLLCTATATALPAIAPVQQIAVGGYAVPTVNNYNPASYGVEGITAGPDGALWYKGLRASKIGRITTAGAITEYPVPSPKSGGGPAGITVGPDGALWFSEPDVIGRITTVGEVTEFSLPAPNGGPSQITSGPDGALWFTETYDNSIDGRRSQLLPRTLLHSPAFERWHYRWAGRRVLIHALGRQPNRRGVLCDRFSKR